MFLLPIDKLISLVGKYAKRNFERNYKVLSVLKEIGITKLEPDFDSIYVNTLVEYGIDAQPPELIKLFANDEVKFAFKKNLYENDINKTIITIEHWLHVGDYHILKKQNINVINENGKFIDILQKNINYTRDPKELELINELRQLKFDKIERSFDFQINRHLYRFSTEFRIEYLDNGHYIDINGEKRNKIIYSQHNNQEDKFRDIDNFHDIKEFCPIDKYIKKWLNNETKNLLIIIGEYGTGKTTLCRHLTYELANEYFKKTNFFYSKNTKTRIPLYIPLRDFEKTIESFIITFFSNNSISDIDYGRFIDRMKNDDFILFFDGFDEMTQKIDSDEKRKNFRKLDQIIETSKNSKVILTVRQEYFKSDDEFSKTINIEENKNYEVIFLKTFNDEQILKFLKSHTDQYRLYWEQINKILDLHDLAKRPVLLQLIIDHLPDVIKENKKGEQIKASDFYNKCIKKELQRKSNELRLELGDKYRLEILERICTWMFLNDELSFNIQLIGEELKLREYFNARTDWEYEKYLNQFLTFTFLLNDSEEKYRISHKSIRDFLVAQSFAKEIINKEIINFGKKPTTPEINNFVIEIVSDKKIFQSIIQNSVTYEENNKFMCSNLAEILIKIDRNSLKKLSLKNSLLTNFNFRGVKLSGTNLENADLSHCDLDNNIFNAKFIKANFRKSSLIIVDINKIPDLSRLNGIISLSLFNNEISKIENLEILKSLSFLNLGQNLINKIENLDKLHNLKELFLNDNELQKIENLNKLINLIKLNINNNQISKIENLNNNLKLQKLNLSYNQIDRIENLNLLNNLNELYLSSNQITKIENLEGLTILRNLDLSNNQITKIENLEGLTILRNLDLSNNQITKIENLEGLTCLRKISLTNNLLKTSEIESLKISLPNCIIEYYR